MPRYVLLRHECPADYRDGPHWDLMLEVGGALRTWSLQELPAAWRAEQQGSDTVPAEELANHRLAYLDYEGEVSGGRGTVRRVARGEFEFTQQSEDALQVCATSGELAGRWIITRESEQTSRLSVARKGESRADYS